MFIDAASLDLTDANTFMASAGAAFMDALVAEYAPAYTEHDRQLDEIDAAERAAAVAHAMFVKANPCKKCSGYGRMDAYAHINHGICFRCGGTGHE